MTKSSPFENFKTSSEIIGVVGMLYVRFPLSLRNIEDLLHERSIEVSHEAVRFWRLCYVRRRMIWNRRRDFGLEGSGSVG